MHEESKLLEVEKLFAGYGKAQVLRGVSLLVAQGECVAFLGPNGAGKTTLLRAIVGLIPFSSGTIRYMAQSLAFVPTSEISRMGVCFISEQSNLFLGMSVEENILLGAYTVLDKKKIGERRDFVFELFPHLMDRRRQLAGTLSGGERKMLGLARGLIQGPRILLIDEPSLGLAPKVVASLVDALRRLNQFGLALLMVEQNVHAALGLATRAYVLEQGEIVLQGTSRELMENDQVRKSYLGVT